MSTAVKRGAIVIRRCRTSRARVQRGTLQTSNHGAQLEVALDVDDGAGEPGCDWSEILSHHQGCAYAMVWPITAA